MQIYLFISIIFFILYIWRIISGNQSLTLVFIGKLFFMSLFWPINILVLLIAVFIGAKK